MVHKENKFFIKDLLHDGYEGEGLKLKNNNVNCDVCTCPKTPEIIVLFKIIYFIQYFEQLNIFTFDKTLI